MSIFIFKIYFPQIYENSVGLLLMVPKPSPVFLTKSVCWFASSEADTETELNVQGFY